jgi:hypothetical protein
MKMAVHIPTRPLRSARRGARAAHRLPQHRTPEQRARHAGGPEDRACYGCGCGFVFKAPVSTTVACPHCGDQQSW